MNSRRRPGRLADSSAARPASSNEVRPGGTEGRERRQTEESASRQEAVLWLSPTTFIQAILSTWDNRDLDPRTADRVPPIVRFHQRLREVFVRDMRPTGVYDNRLRSAMEFFTGAGWLEYQEIRDVMGGAQVTARARDTGRFSAAYSGNAPINDQDQIRIPNFFSSTGAIIPADLYEPVREHYTRAILGIFDLERTSGVQRAESLRSLPVAPGEAAQQARQHLLGSLETISSQVRSW